MMADLTQIRRDVAGSGLGEPNPAVNSRADGGRESGVTGSAPPSYVTPIAGGELHVIEAGRRMAVQIRTGRGLRNRLTASMALDDAEVWFRRGLELAVNARLSRQNKGA